MNTDTLITHIRAYINGIWTDLRKKETISPRQEKQISTTQSREHNLNEDAYDLRNARHDNRDERTRHRHNRITQQMHKSLIHKLILFLNYM